MVNGNAKYINMPKFYLICSLDSEETDAADGTKEETLEVKVTIPEGMDFSKLLGQYKYPLAIFFWNVRRKGKEEANGEGQSIVRNQNQSCMKFEIEDDWTGI